MKPGPDLDALIAEKLMTQCVHDDVTERAVTGYRHRCRKCGDLGHGMTRGTPPCPAYSTDITAAWSVLENTRLHGAFISVTPRPDGRWSASRAKALNPRGDGTSDDYDDTYPEYSIVADTAPMAICMAALSVFLYNEMDEYLVDCFCGKTVSQPHASDCAFDSLNSDVQEAFRRVRP